MRKKQPYLKLEENPSFSLLVIGCGGGPLETNLSSYLFKPYGSSWEEGCIGLECGSGMGAISHLLEDPTTSSAFDDFELPTEGDVSAVQKAAHVFGSIRSFLISHAHFDHIQGLVIASGAVPGVRQIFASPQTLINLEHVFDGGTWPKLARWDDEPGLAYKYRSISPKGSNPTEDVHVFAMPISHGKSIKSGSYDSTAFFISNTRDEEDLGGGGRKEYLFFGDVEPDSLSGRPLNRFVWERAASSIRSKRLSTIFIECSYDVSRPVDQLYGHLSPRYVFEELRYLASLLNSPLAKEAVVLEKEHETTLGVNGRGHGEDEIADDGLKAKRTRMNGHGEPNLEGRLKGINVCIIHVKDEVGSSPSRPPSPPPPRPNNDDTSTSEAPCFDSRCNDSDLDPDVKATSLRVRGHRAQCVGMKARERIHRQLLDLEEENRLGVRFVMCEPGLRIDL